MARIPPEQIVGTKTRKVPDGWQVYTAEEKAALTMFNMEESKRKEEKILAEMQLLVQRTIGEVEGEDGDNSQGSAEDK